MLPFRDFRFFVVPLGLLLVVEFPIFVRVFVRAFGQFAEEPGGVVVDESVVRVAALQFQVRQGQDVLLGAENPAQDAFDLVPAGSAVEGDDLDAAGG